MGCDNARVIQTKLISRRFSTGFFIPSYLRLFSNTTLHNIDKNLKIWYNYNSKTFKNLIVNTVIENPHHNCEGLQLRCFSYISKNIKFKGELSWKK